MLEILLKRRSTRNFKNRPVEKVKVDSLIRAALLSPSSRNIRPWEFVVTEDSSLIEKLSRSKEHGSAFLKGAPLAVCVIADPEKSDVWIEDTSIAAIIIQLAAESLGLGSCWIQIRKRKTSSGASSDDYVKKTLGIPENYAVESVIAVGYRADEARPHSEADLRFEKIHCESFGRKHAQGRG